MMWKKVLFAAVYVVLVLTLAGCSPPVEPAPPDDITEAEPANDPAAIELTAADNGSTIELAAGQALSITLESNPSTGYLWVVEEIDESVIAQAGESDFISESEDPMPGEGGAEMLRFEAQAPGECSLMLIYRQPWEGGDVSDLEFIIQVVVK